jgi:hypothetical protein
MTEPTNELKNSTLSRVDLERKRDIKPISAHDSFDPEACFVMTP